MVDLLTFFLIFRKWTIPSESTIKPTSNCFEWHVVIIIRNNKNIPMYITNGKVFGGTPNILIFWLFLDNLSISEQTIDRALNNSYRTIIQWRKIISFDFHHIPKLSIGFNIFWRRALNYVAFYSFSLILIIATYFLLLLSRNLGWRPNVRLSRWALVEHYL